MTVWRCPRCERGALTEYTEGEPWEAVCSYCGAMFKELEASVKQAVTGHTKRTRKWTGYLRRKK